LAAIVFLPQENFLPPLAIGGGGIYYRGRGYTREGYAMAPKRQFHNPDGAVCGCGAHTEGRKAVAVDADIKAANLKRLRRIEGQIRGLQKMVEEDRYCADIMVQISSAQEALRSVGRALMRNHLRHCAAQAIGHGSPEEAEAMYDELLELIYKHSR
jgi:CsoR family transcriptional regulator, copper-sensing transcriptional repressor